MRIKFEKLATYNGKVYVDFGEGFQEYDVVAVKDEGIPIPASCTDYENIKIKGTTEVFKTPEVIAHINAIKEPTLESRNCVIDVSSYTKPIAVTGSLNKVEISLKNIPSAGEVKAKIYCYKKHAQNNYRGFGDYVYVFGGLTKTSFVGYNTYAFYKEVAATSDSAGSYKLTLFNNSMGYVFQIVDEVDNYIFSNNSLAYASAWVRYPEKDIVL